MEEVLPPDGPDLTRAERTGDGDGPEELLDHAGVVVGRESANQLGGPIRIAEVAGEAWKSGLDVGGLGTAIASLPQRNRAPAGR